MESGNLLARQSRLISESQVNETLLTQRRWKSLLRIIPWVDIQMCAHPAHTFLKDRRGAERQLTLFAPPLCHKHKGFFSFHENGMKALTEETVVQILEERAI